MEENRVGFTIDAGLINRLGYELVGRVETALSELIKNSYDADATVVNVDFENTSRSGGRLIISDNGVGMTTNQLLNGFMRISSSDKIHNPISNRFRRTKAGKKGIGRFATQRLGNTLTIITQTKESPLAIKLTIDWSLYTSDVNISDVTFPIESCDKLQEEGTILRIEGLKDSWTESSIKRVYRYVFDLFQPDYLSELTDGYKIAKSNDPSFVVNFFLVNETEKTPFANESLSIFDKALAVIEGVIDDSHKPNVKVISKNLGLNDTVTVEYTEESPTFTDLSNVRFKIYYFIYNRIQYYRNSISKTDLNKIQELSKTASGVRLYRNGFRVLPYGESTDDWINIDRRWSSVSGIKNVPLNNKNLFGFVEILDRDGSYFEETASREGLIENEAFKQLSDFLNKSLIKAKERIAEKITIFKEVVDEDDPTEDSDFKDHSNKEMIDKLHVIFDKIDSNERDKETGLQIIDFIGRKLEESSMLRVLAGLGLTIGEFVHEITQYRPAVYGHIAQLNTYNLSPDITEHINSLKIDFDKLFGYTKYFGTTISQNIDRRLESLDILKVIDSFKSNIESDLVKNEIHFELKIYDYDVMTIPMHWSEWNSILYNLYTNSRKAIKRANVKGRILIEIEGSENYIFLKFHDNGNGIKEEDKDRVFNAFFSTSTPASFDAPKEDQFTGTGLGLKIVNDILLSYNGSIKLVEPQNGFNTCFEIKIKKHK